MFDSRKKRLTIRRSAMRTVRTLHVITDRDRRGAQVHAWDLAAGLRSAGADADVVALAPGRHGDSLPVESLGLTRLAGTTLRALRRRARDYEIVIAHGSTTLVAAGVAVAPGTPIVYRQISDPLFWAATWGRQVRTAALLRRTRSVVVLSDGTGSVFAGHYGLSSSRLVTIPNAVPADSWSRVTLGEQAKSRQALGIPVGALVAASLGALVEEKGVDASIRSIAAVPTAHLVVAGDGPARQELQHLGVEAAPGRVHFLGPVDTPRQVLAAADVLLLPSRGGDSMPAVLIEAGLCGLPVVTTSVGAIPDVVVDGLTGRVTAVGEDDAFLAAVGDVLGDETKRHAYGAAAHDRCRSHFTIEAVVPRWQRLFASLVK